MLLMGSRDGSLPVDVVTAEVESVLVDDGILVEVGFGLGENVQEALVGSRGGYGGRV